MNVEKLICKPSVIFNISFVLLVELLMTSSSSGGEGKQTRNDHVKVLKREFLNLLEIDFTTVFCTYGCGGCIIQRVPIECRATVMSKWTLTGLLLVRVHLVPFVHTVKGVLSDSC